MLGPLQSDAAAVEPLPVLNQPEALSLPSPRRSLQPSLMLLGISCQALIHLGYLAHVLPKCRLAVALRISPTLLRLGAEFLDRRYFHHDGFLRDAPRGQIVLIASTM